MYHDMSNRVGALSKLLSKKCEFVWAGEEQGFLEALTDSLHIVRLLLQHQFYPTLILLT